MPTEIVHTPETCIAAYHAYKALGNRLSETSDPVINAGAFLVWADGNLKRAIECVETHVSGKYIDRPPFSGCAETLKLLKEIVL